MKSVARMGLCLLLAGAFATPGVGLAQSVIGSSCATFPAVFNQQQVVTLNQSVAAGRLIVVGVAVNAPANFTGISDSAASSYPIVNAVALYGGTGILAAYARRTTSVLNAGSSITLQFFSTGSTTAQSCVSVASFPGVLPITSPDDAYGSNSGSGSSLAVTSSTPTQYANELVYSVFASAATPGAIAALAHPRTAWARRAAAIPRCACCRHGTLARLPRAFTKAPMRAAPMRFPGAPCRSRSAATSGSLPTASNRRSVFGALRRSAKTTGADPFFDQCATSSGSSLFWNR